MAGEHVDGMHLPLHQCVKVSPRRLKVMTSRSKRFTSALTYAAGETRVISPIEPAYENELGPGSYKGAEFSSMAIDRPLSPQCNFASGTPRLPRDRPPLNVGSNYASVDQDRHTWQQPKVWMAKAHSGRNAHGPQIGSYEDLEGLGRATSPERRSPDVAYSLNNSMQKRPLALEMSSSRQRYSPAFRSHSPRLVLSRDEKRSLNYPTDATDQFDLSASAATAFTNFTISTVAFDSELSAGASTRGSPRGSPAFASETGRFPPVRTTEGSEVDLVAADRRSWTAAGQPLTANSDRFARSAFDDSKSGADGDASPGPGTYIKQRVWEPRRNLVDSEGDRRSARRRLDVELSPVR